MFILKAAKFDNMVLNTAEREISFYMPAVLHFELWMPAMSFFHLYSVLHTSVCYPNLHRRPFNMNELCGYLLQENVNDSSRI